MDPSIYATVLVMDLFVKEGRYKRKNTEMEPKIILC
jgi:hypothetical protein